MPVVRAGRPESPPAGFTSVRVLTGWDVLEGAGISGPVLLVDENGHYESVDVADTLTRAGHQVAAGTWVNPAGICGWLMSLVSAGVRRTQM
jgi:hypothetical protein